MERWKTHEEHFCLCSVNVKLQPIWPCSYCHFIVTRSSSFLLVNCIRAVEWSPSDRSMLAIFIIRITDKKGQKKKKRLHFYLLECHVRTHPPHERIEDEHVCISPVASMLFNWLKSDNTILNVVIYWIITVWFYQ